MLVYSCRSGDELIATTRVATNSGKIMEFDINMLLIRKFVITKNYILLMLLKKKLSQNNYHFNLYKNKIENLTYF